MFYWNKIQNNKINLWYIKKKIVIFYYKSTYNSSSSSQNCVSKNASFLGNPKSHHHDPKTTRIQNSN